MNKSKKVKVIFVHLLNDYSGSPKVLSQVMNAFNDYGVEYELFKGSKGEGFLGSADEHKNYLYRYSKYKFLTFLYFIISQLSIFLKILKYKNENIIIYINTMLPFGAALAGKLLNKKVIYHIHETSISPSIFKYFLRKIASYSATSIIFVSKFLSKKEAFKKIPSTVIYNSLDSEFVKIASQSSYSTFNAENKFNILMVCSLKHYKGIDQLLIIAKKCIDYPSIKFTVVFNAEKEEIDEYFVNKKISRNIKIYSKMSSLHEQYSNASLVLNLSLVDKCIEAFGLTLIEAMAYGIPVIGPPVGGPDEIIINGTHGYKIDSYNVDEIVKRIKGMHDNDKLMLHLSKNCITSSRKFNVDKFNFRIIKFIEKNA